MNQHLNLSERGCLSLSERYSFEFLLKLSVEKVAANPDERAAIVMIPHDDPTSQVKRLAEAGVIADARPGHVRLSPFFYNVKEDNVAAIEVLRP